MGSILQKPSDTVTPNVLLDGDGKPKVYSQRWHVLFAYTFAATMWNFEWGRYGPITSEYALFYDTTNEFSPPELGIDFLSLSAQACSIISYPIAGYLIDSYGLNILTLGAAGQTLGNWIFFLAGSNFPIVILGRIITALSGPLVYGSILRIAAHWFPQSERILAIALATFVSGIGGSAALLIPPLFITGDLEVVTDLKSCNLEPLGLTVEDFTSGNLSMSDCPVEIDDQFCCAAPTNIGGINLLIAILTTIGAVYAFFVVKDSPPTPPAASGIVKPSMGFLPSIKHLFSHWNYTLINLADFLASGVALVIYNTISRIFPSEVQQAAIYVGSGAMPLAIPLSYAVSWYIGKTGKYYELTASFYYLGFACWIMATIGLAIGGGALFLMVLGASAAVVVFLLWSVTVYELKLEYVYTPQFALAGTVVSIDRTIVNIAGLTFLSSIPPERFDGQSDTVSGRMFTMLVGAAVFFVAIAIITLLPNKRAYKRKAFELEQEKNAEVEDEEKEKKDTSPEATDSTLVPPKDIKVEEANTVAV